MYHDRHLFEDDGRISVDNQYLLSNKFMQGILKTVGCHHAIISETQLTAGVSTGLSRSLSN